MPSGIAAPRLLDLPRSFGILGRALDARRPRAPRPTTGGAGRRRRGRRTRRAGDLDRPARPLTELAAAIPGPDGPWGVLLLVADPGPIAGSTDVGRRRPSSPTPSGRSSSVAHRAGRGRPTCSIAPRRCAASPATSAAAWTSIASSPASSTTPWSCSRATARPCSCAGPTAPTWPRSAAACRPATSTRSATGPGALAVDRRDRRPAAALRGRTTATTRVAPTCVPRSSRRASTRSARRRSWTAPSSLGMLNVYHDQPHAWTPDELETIAALATQASVAIRTAQNFQQMADLDRAAPVDPAARGAPEPPHERPRHRPGHRHRAAPAHRLPQRPRLPRPTATDLVPVAMQGQVGEYVDETPDQLRVAVGEGITGWVAEHRVAAEPARRRQRPARQHDPRHRGGPRRVDAPRADALRGPGARRARPLEARPRTSSRDDDLRLLVIYASFAAQAMANADTTAAPARAVGGARAPAAQPARAPARSPSRSSRRSTRRAVLEGITDRLGALIACDNIAIEVVDPSTGLLTPLTARGVHADAATWSRGSRARPASPPGWSSTTSRSTSRTSATTRGSTSSATTSTPDGSLIVVPLRGRAGAIGVLTIERLGRGNTVRRRGVRPRQAVRGAGLDRAAERGGLPGRRDPRPDRRPDRACSTTARSRSTSSGASARATPFGLIMLDLDDFREVNNALRPPGRRRGSCAGSPRR